MVLVVLVDRGTGTPKDMYFCLLLIEKRELNRKLICECRCDERLKVKTEGSTRLTYTGSSGQLEHIKDKDEVNRREVSECDG